MLPASAEVETVLGSIRANVNRAVCLGGTCLKVRPAVGSCCRYVTGLLLLCFFERLVWKIKPSSDQMAFKPPVMWASRRFGTRRCKTVPVVVSTAKQWELAEQNGFLLLRGS